MTLNLRKLLPIAIILTPMASHALPVDWHGSFGVDTTMITDYRRIAATQPNAITNDSQEVALAAGNKATASFQSYVLRLSPDVIINDAATFKSEFTTGYADGGFIGDSPQTSSSATGNVGNYYYNQAAGAGLNIKQAYVELNSDIATWLIGRHAPKKWALGAMFDDGKDDEGRDTWSRHAYSRDGVTALFKFNNFVLSPFWAQSSNNGLTRATDAKEYGASFLYDNKDKDISFGVYYSKKTDNFYNSFYQSSIGTTTQDLGDTNVKVTDIYLKKIFGKVTLSAEVPILSGTLGHVVNRP